MKFTRNLLLQSMHKDWYVCQQKQKQNIHSSTNIMLDFYNGNPDVLSRCTFLFHPIAQNENKFKMCKNVLGPVKHPIISGQPLPHPPHLIPPSPPPSPSLPSCIPVCPAGTVGGAPGQPSSAVIPPPHGITGVPLKPPVTAAKSRCSYGTLLNKHDTTRALIGSKPKHRKLLRVLISLKQ